MFEYMNYILKFLLVLLKQSPGSQSDKQLKLYEPMPTADRKDIFDKNYPYDRDFSDDKNQNQTVAVDLHLNQNETAEATTVSSSDKISKSAQPALLETGT